jgi:HSP20 family protein
MTRRDIDQLQREIQELFSDLWQVPRFSMRGGFRPHADCYRTEDPPALTVIVELPGVDPDEIQLTVGDSTLVVAGIRKRPRCEGQVYNQMELDYGPFRRQIQLSEPVDVEQAQATYERGLLTVVMPLAQTTAPGERVSIAVSRA